MKVECVCRNLEEFNSFVQVENVGAERLPRRIRSVQPEVGDSAEQQRVRHALACSAQQRLSAQTAAHFFQRGPNRCQQAVVPDQFLLQHRVHTLLVPHRVLRLRTHHSPFTTHHFYVHKLCYLVDEQFKLTPLKDLRSSSSQVLQILKSALNPRAIDLSWW